MESDGASMPATLEEVRKAIQQAFPDADVDSLQEQNHRVTGTIVSREFEGKDAWERNRLVTERVRDRLGLRGVNVGFPFPVAPGEQ